MRKSLPAPCGLDCTACDLFNAAHDLQAAGRLVDWFRSLGWIGEDEGTDAVQRKAPFCMGCRDGSATRWCSDCRLLTCCDGKSHAHCGECADFPCGTYREWTVGMTHHLAAMEALLAKRK